MNPSSSPLRGKYLVRNRLLNAGLRLIDALLPSQSEGPIASPRRILVANIAHLGDVLYSTGVLPVLRNAFPQVRIGFLAGSWSRSLLEGHPLLDWLHTFDHARLNRGGLGWAGKLRQHLATRRQALADIRAVGYDLAIDLYAYFPNALPLLHAAQIPTRVGYTSGGFGPLLTKPLDWPLRDWHITDYHAHLLNQLPLRFPVAGPLPAVLPEVQASLPEDLPGWFIQVHPASGNPIKEWPLKRWRDLVCALVARGHKLVFTGAGSREQQICATLADGLPGCIDYSGRLGWHSFVGVICRAGLLLGVDSIAGHVAATVGTPCVVVSAGITGERLWSPLGAHVRTLGHPVACAPCWRSQGCEGMNCVRDVPVDIVLGAVETLLAGQPARLDRVA